MRDAPRLLFPQEPPNPWRSLLQRLGIAIGIVMFIALLALIGRDGYSDADGSPLSLLDAIYYSTVTVTTTGYGDIAPISPGARAVTAFVVTPLRVVFLVVLVGTTLELLTERFRQSRAEARWRRTMRDTRSSPATARWAARPSRRCWPTARPRSTTSSSSIPTGRRRPAPGRQG